MFRRYLAVVVLGSIVCLVGCSDDDDSSATQQPFTYSDYVDPNGLVWAVGTMGGLKAIDMADTVVRSVNLGWTIYDYVAVAGRRIWVAGGTGNTPLQRVTLLTDSTDTIEATTKTVAGQIGRPMGLEAAGGRVWVVGRARKALFGVDTAANTIDLQLDFSGVADSGGCLGLAPLGPAMYVLSANPFTVHAVNMSNATVMWQCAVDTEPDTIGKAFIGAAGSEVYVYVAGRRELTTLSCLTGSVLRRVIVSDVIRTDEWMTASSAGVFVSNRADTTHTVMKVSPVTGGTLAHFALRPRVEAVSALQAFGQRLLVTIIDSSTGQNAVLELRPSDMTLMHRVNHVYVTRVAVQR